MDSNLLKEAIADAKAVRQTALANAKVALEEAFSERYHAMFAEKLKEDAELEGSQPAAGMKQDDNTVGEQEIDELIKELEAEVGGEQQPPAPEPDADDAAGQMPPAPAPMAPPMGAAPAVPGAVPPGCPPPMGGIAPTPAIGAPMGAPMGGDMGMGAPAPMAPPIGGEMGAPAPQAPATPPSDVPPTSGDTDEDVNLDELLASLKEEIEGDEAKKDEDDTIDEQTKLASSAIGGKTGGSDNKKPSTSASKSSHIETGGMKNNGLPDSTQEAKDATDASRPNQAKNATSTNLSTPSKGGESGPALKAARPNSKGEFENTAKLNEENEALKTQLNEAEDVIKYVKTQLNEVNLLNAKLLYTNKLFKEFNMNNEQKMRIVEMFDLSKNVREVKLTYANLAETLNFGGIDTKKKVASASPSSVQSITEGLASKPVGSTKPSKEIISEGKSSQMVTKFQRLAGIKRS